MSVGIGSLCRMRDSFPAAIGAYTTHLRALGRSPQTVNLRRLQLQRFARDVGRSRPTAVTLTDVELWMAGQSWSSSTRRSHRAAVRSFYAYLVRQGMVERSPVLDLESTPPDMPNPRPVPDGPFAFALAVADERVRLMLRLAAEAGLRRGEVAQVHTRDLIEDLFGWSLVVHGKGGKIRTVPVTDDLAEAIRSRGPGWMFPGNIEGHLSAAYVGKLVKRLLPPEYSMHKLRTRFGSKAYAVSHDIIAVQDLMGHSSPAITRVYIRVPDDAKRRIVNSL